MKAVKNNKNVEHWKILKIEKGVDEKNWFVSRETLFYTEVESME